MCSENLTVLKFGGSVLHNEDDLPRVVQEIYRHLRNGEQVLAVVSAFYGKTDELQNKAQEYGEGLSQQAYAALLGTGEATSAALLTMALDRAGIPVKLLSPEQTGIKTEGDTLDSEPISVDSNRLKKELEGAVVVISGFIGTNQAGDLTLLGRGGTDLTAVFLAEKLNGRCRLIKDVDGLYESDPADFINHLPRRFKEVSFQTAGQVGGKLIQTKAIRFAEKHNLDFEISALTNSGRTKVGNYPDNLDFSNKIKQAEFNPLKVVILGCGTVGGGVYGRLQKSLSEFVQIVGVANLDPEKAIKAGVPPELNTQNVYELIGREEVDVVIELIGGVEPAYSMVKQSLRYGKHVVTANKAVIAKYGQELNKIAAANNAALRYSASVGGVLPALEISAQTAAFENDPPQAITGIINGTCNFICDRLLAGVEFAEAVREAQEKGFAEADPTLDLNGTDAAQKLILLARACFGIDLRFDDIDRTGIDNLSNIDLTATRKLGNSIRLVIECRFQNGKIKASVLPIELPSTHPFADVKGADNCLLIETEKGKQKLIRGRGAGRFATSEAVIADLFDIYFDLQSADSVLECSKAKTSPIVTAESIQVPSNSLAVKEELV